MGNDSLDELMEDTLQIINFIFETDVIMRMHKSHFSSSVIKGFKSEVGQSSIAPRRG